MSRSKATKRRKVWVTFKGEKRRTPAAVNVSAADALNISKWHGTKAVPMVERLPGDVVLSREDVKWLLSKALVTDFESADDRSRTLALLRGRR